MADPKKILIVDDDESIRDIFSYALKAEGYVIETAEDGQDGLEKIAASQPDLVILDLMMPRLGGFEVVHRLQTPETVKIPIIVVTGYSNEANDQIRKEPNVADLLSKPIKPSELKEAIGRVLGKP